MDLGLSGKLIVVVGGAGEVGRSVCQTLIEEGAIVEVADLQRGVDMGSQTQAESYFRELREKYPTPLYGLVSTVKAADVTQGRLLNLTETEWGDGFRSNFYPAMFAIQQAVPWMQKEGIGKIVVVSTMNGQVSAAESPYDESHAALARYASNIGAEYAKSGISSVVLCPDAVATQAWHEKGWDTTLQAVADHTPDGKITTVEEVAFWVTCFLSPQAAAFNSRILPIDRGINAGQTPWFRKN